MDLPVLEISRTCNPVLSHSLFSRVVGVEVRVSILFLFMAEEQSTVQTDHHFYPFTHWEGFPPFGRCEHERPGICLNASS